MKISQLVRWRGFAHREEYPSLREEYAEEIYEAPRVRRARCEAVRLRRAFVVFFGRLRQFIFARPRVTFVAALIPSAVSFLLGY